MNVPLRFVPFLRPSVWGSRRLGEVLNKTLPADTSYGESWDLSDHPLHHGIVASGPWDGRSLRDLMEREREDLLGAAARRYQVFPWLVKFLDAADWLSVQVHPDDVAVKKLWPGEGGKTEAWFVLDVQPGSRIYAGLLPGTDEARVRALLAEGKVAECLHSFEPRPGDCLFLPAGTVHAVGGGVLMAEVQQTSDATFRLFDWNRRDAEGKSRTLHIEESLACIDWTRGPVQPLRAKHYRRLPGTISRQTLVECPFFHLEYLAAGEPFSCGGSQRLQVLVVLEGEGTWETAHGLETISRGQVWLLPAALPRLTCRPSGNLGALLSTLP